jgi:hypothetical protein
MGRVAHIRMKITDFKVDDRVAVIAVEIRKGTYVFRRAYGLDARALNSFDLEEFKKHVYTDALKLIGDKEFEEAVMRRIDDMIGVQIALD